MIGNADLTQALLKSWRDSGLDNEFKSYWVDESKKTQFRVIHDTTASVGQPFPYCVFELGDPQTRMRTTGGHADRRQREYRRVSLVFNVHTRDTATEPAKNVAAFLCEKIQANFGGHPTIRPAEMSLSHGRILLFQFSSESTVRSGEQEFQWVLRYEIDVDVPVAIE